MNHFPVYTPSENRIAEIEKTLTEVNNPLNIHFNASKDNRAMGAGFYQFSADEETRRAQMEELKTVREETIKLRQEVGAVDIKAGEVEGMQAGEIVRSRAIEKRKRELKERRALIEAKRKRLKADDPTLLLPSATEPAIKQEQPIIVTSAAAADPFAALEGQVAPPKTEKGKVKGKLTEADTFLAQLERDLLASRGK